MPHERLVPQIATSDPRARAIPSLVISLILAEVRFCPYRFQERGEAFVEPAVAPILAGDQIAEPLVPELVRDQVIFAGEVFGGELGMHERSAGVGGSAGILHAAGDEIIDHNLRIFFPGVVDAKFFAEYLHHRRSASVVDVKAAAASLPPLIAYRDAP